VGISLSLLVPPSQLVRMTITCDSEKEEAEIIQNHTSLPFAPFVNYWVPRREFDS
jgi:hypothetical protein